MVRIINHKKGDSTVEDMNQLASYLMTRGLANEDTPISGFQGESTALCDFEVHVIRKKVR